MVSVKDLVLHALGLVGGGLLVMYGVLGVLGAALSIKVIVSCAYTM